ncbi:serine hydrolase [Microterricola viridarii]|uniref:Dipeptidyl aminopeptidase/acylaminoacyl peptidase n=1 Tax=Microterricola viridarii TaxID=412690 RepID=A0A1H1YGN6_9MICO|nr:serine hydrolase [Microterricola viridarii]SDT20603.1 Dipeptidyl aminopeptidase/acylaminoacyl peptidase [Microterricola viridarii]
MNDQILPAQQAAPRPATIEDYLDVVIPAGLATDAAGRTVFARQANDRASDSNTSSLWLIGADGAARALTEGPNDSNPVWNSATGDVLFLRPDASGTAQLHAINADGGAVRPLTTAARLPQGAGVPVVSPDGTRVAFSATVSRGSAAALVSRGLRHKVDGVGARGSARAHLFELDLASGALTRLSDGDWDASEAAYSPDGRKLAFSAGIDADADRTLETRVLVIDLTDRTAAALPVGRSRAVHAPLLWAPAGDAVLAVGAEAPGIRNAELIVLHLDPALADVSLTAALDRNVMPGGMAYPGGRPTLTADGEVLFCLREGGSTELHAVPIAGGPARKILGGAQRVVSGFAASQGSVRAVLATESSFGEIVEVPIAGGEPVALTSFGAPLAGVAVPVAEERWFDISDGSRVQGWTLRDPSLTQAGPLVLDVHGGPHNAWTGTPSIMQPHHAELVARGYTVLMLNPRGSDGYGQAFFNGVQDAWGEADLPDLLEPIDALVADGVADPAQLLVTGYSYGGFMTCALTAFTDRFAVAVAGGLVADLAHLTGASDDGVLLDHLEFRRGSGRARALSPLDRVDQVTAPTLILHGAADLLCPALQAEQWHGGLLLAGVESELVLYPGGSHAFVLVGPPSHRVDYSRRLVDWFERHLSPTPAAATVERDYWQTRLETVIEKYGIPGAALGILTTTRSGTETTVVSAGLTSTATGVPVTDDTLFQIGSITKVYTGTLIMQLVEEGLLDLDAPVRAVLPGFTVADAHASATVTPRQLLTHTSGIDGDIFTDTGRGHDCVELFVDSLGEVTSHFAPGVNWSYCNTGFVVLGRIIEVLRGAYWHEVVTERILQPLGLGATTMLQEDTMLFRHALGHGGDARSGSATPVTQTSIVPSARPAGLISAQVDDVLAFLADSMSAEPRLLSTAGHRLMLEDQQVSDSEGVAEIMGLSWLQYDWNGVRVHGHDGGTIGQQAFARAIASKGVAFVLLTNGGLMTAASDELFAEIAQSIAGARMTAPFAASSLEPVDAETAAALAGRYRDASAEITLAVTDGALVATRVDGGNPSGREEMAGTTEFTVHPGAGGHLAAGAAGRPGWTRVWLVEHEGGRLLHFGSRAFPEVSDAVVSND